MTQFAHLITPTGLTAFIDGAQYAIPVDHPNFGRIVAAVQSNRIADVLELIDIRNSVRKFISTDVRFALVNDQISFNGESFTQPVTDKVLELIEAGNAPAPLFKFLEKVRLNPSKTAQDELLLFCVANGFMIDTNGDIVAYKSVRADFKDIHSGTIENKIGQLVKMPRHQVDDNRERTCSHGLHFASYEYASTWAGQDNLRLMVLAVNPKNVVSIPSDYNNQKGRTSEYTVIAELAGFKELPKKAVYSAADLGGVDETAEKEAALEKYEKVLARKVDTQDKLENEIDDLHVKIGQIEELGGLVPDEMYDELSRKEDVLERITGDIEDLEVKIDVLNSELSMNDEDEDTCEDCGEDIFDCTC